MSIDAMSKVTGSVPTRRTMVPPDDALPDVLPTDRLNTRGMATPAWRDELRRIPNGRNVLAVVSTIVQSFGVVVAAAIINTWWSYLIAFVLMARGHVCMAILGHEAAHRLLFSNRRANDVVGRWIMSYPGPTSRTTATRWDPTSPTCCSMRATRFRATPGGAS
jgi:hypothetical protein